MSRECDEGDTKFEGGDLYVCVKGQWVIHDAVADAPIPMAYFDDESDEGEWTPGDLSANTMADVEEEAEEDGGNTDEEGTASYQDEGA